MNRDEAMRRDIKGLPIESARELVFVLQEVQRRRAPQNTPTWYLLNRLQRIAMTAATDEDSGLAQGPNLEDRVTKLESLVEQIAEHPALSVPPLRKP